MPAGEYPYSRSGVEFPVFDLGDCMVGIATCFDNVMPEVARILALKGAEVILSPRAAQAAGSRTLNAPPEPAVA